MALYMKHSAWILALLVLVTGSVAAPVKEIKLTNNTCNPGAALKDLSDTYVAAAALRDILPANFTGDVSIPSNAALLALADTVFEGISNLTGVSKFSLLSDENAINTILSTPAIQDVLKLHIAPFDPEVDALLESMMARMMALLEELLLKNLNQTIVKTTFSDFANANFTSLLSRNNTAFCPNGPKTALSVHYSADVRSNITAIKAKRDDGIAYNVSAHVTSSAGNASVLTAYLLGKDDNCNSTVLVIDAVLLPCKLKESSVPALVSTLARSYNVSMLPSMNGTNSTNSSKSSNVSGNSTSGGVVAVGGVSHLVVSAVLGLLLLALLF